MTTYKEGTIVFLDFPYTAGGPGKPRPALVVLDPGDADIVVACMTSRTPRTRFDVDLADWSKAGLILPTVVRLDKLMTAEKSFVRRTLGALTGADRKSVAAVLSKLFERW